MSVRKFNQVKPTHLSSRQTSLRLSPVCHAIALMLAAGATMNVHAATNLANIGAQMSAARNGAAASGRANLGFSPQQALQQSQPSIQNLAHAAQGIAQQIAAQQAAAVAGLNTASNVPNGLTPGGLQVAPGVSFDPATNAPTAATSSLSNPNLWVNANGPTQSVESNGHVDVNVQQTAQNAVLTWQTMNVGRQTTLNFDQSGGTQSNGANNWVVLNRIQDPSGKPSQILGNVTAQGSVYVVNRNGILFGAGSQVNVHSLAVSSLDLLNQNDDLVQTSSDIIASNKLFMQQTGGLAGLEAGETQTGGGSGVGTTGNPNEVFGLGNNVSVPSAGQYPLPGDITIQPGASITTQATGTVSDGGFVLIAAPNINNGGSITATNGQVILAAGIGVSLRPDSNPQVLVPELSGKISASDTGADITPAGTLTNTGIVQAARGNINLLGSTVDQNGVVGVTTSVNAPGSITISTVDEYSSNTPSGGSYFSGQPAVTATPTGGGDDTHRAGQLIFGNGSVTTAMPDTDGETATSAPGTIFTPGSITMTAGSVWFQSGSLIEAPGSSVSVAALTPNSALDATPPGDTAVQGRIYLDAGATIDVSGISNVELPIADELVTVPLIGQNELANSPLLRDGFLNGFKNLVFDSTLSGTNADGSQWVGSPILNLAGYVSLIPRSVDQLLVNGGSITLAGNEVMTATGSSLNLNGGYIHYDGGMVNTTRLIDANGAIVPIGQASPFDTFVGVAGDFIENHPRWGVTKDWFDPLLNSGAFEPDFIVGGNAGTLNIFATQALVLDGGITAQTFGGSKQVQDDDQPVGGTFNLGANPGGASLAALTQGVGASTGESGTVILQNSAPQLGNLALDFSANTPLDTTALGALSSTDPDNVLATKVVPTDTLSNGGFANVNVTEDKTGGAGIVVAAGSTLTVQPGGSISLNTGAPVPLMVLGDLIAPSGTISLASGGGDIVVGPGATLSVAGLWVNNDMQTAVGTTPGDSEFIDGGSITLSTTDISTAGSNQNASGPIGDLSGSIELQAGSVVDVSSGGEMQANGQMLMQDGIPEGKGGDLSLLTYFAPTQKQFGDTGDGGNVLPTTQPTHGRIEMDGTINSEGFDGGGTLTLQALGFQIGGDPAQAPSWNLYLPTSFFSSQGFGKYVLNAMYDATVAPGATIVLMQQNRIPNLLALQQADTGASIWANGLTTSGTLDLFHRQATDLVITAGDYLTWIPQTANLPLYAGVTGGVTVGEGASIIGDAGASIGLGSPAQVTVLGSLIAPGGSITLSADTNSGGFALPGQETTKSFTSPSQSVWLGPNALLDVAGIALTDPLAAPVNEGMQSVIPNIGKVLPGGSVILSDDTGYVVAQAGSVIDVSGTSATFDALQPSGRYAPQQVWSDAGSITLAADSGLYFDGTLRAQPGAAQAQGGTLTILPDQNALSNIALPGSASAMTPGATALIIQQSGELVPAGLVPGGDISDNPTGVLQFSADRLTGSGISTLVLGDSTVNGGTSSVPVGFAGNVDLSLSRAVIIDAGQIVALPAGSTSIPALTAGVSAIGAPTVTIDAPYVALVGLTLVTGRSTDMTSVAALADGTLNINASFIDLENQIQLNNFGQANFTSSGDIRLSSISPSLANGNPNALEAGELFTPGNLTFKAADVYPSTASTFILDAVGPNDLNGNPLPTTITFLPNGASDVPLSAGGTLLVDATNIVQSGTVRAPSGTLVFGVGDPGDAATKAQFNGMSLVGTRSVSLTDGSVTSVSNDGAIIPYGITVDGVEWQYNPLAGDNAAPDVSAPPSKFISVNGSNVSLNQGATVDLSGGGDLQAEEWVPGTGGSRDLLSQYNVSFASSPSGVAVPVNVGAGNVYAILPGKQAPVAAYDPMFAQTAQPDGTNAPKTVSAGVGQAALGGEVGQSVYLSGVPGLPAGYYTLLPAKYATLPGAFRVTVSSVGGALTPGASQILPDGTVAVAGYMGNALDGSRSATPTLFDVQSGAVWQQYSQYTLTSANSFFPALAASAGHVTPQLPMDGGQLVLAATTGLSLGGTLKAAPADGGAPAEVDIASQDIQIVGSGEAALPGYLQISADQLDALGAGSLLIGGTRTQTISGITIDSIANSVVVSNDAANPLTGPEVILVTKTDSTGTDPNAANGLRVDAGSVITANGSYPAGKEQPITIGQNADSTTGALAISGDGALLSVSNGAASVVARLDTAPAATNAGLLTVGAGATLTGGQALTLDSSGNLTFDPSAALSGKTIAVDGSAITFTDKTGAAAAAIPGFVVGATQLTQLANADEVILRSSGMMNFDGNVDVTFGKNVDLSAGTFSSDGGTVTINAQDVAFTNEVGAPLAAGTAISGTLTVNANEIDFGTGDKAVAGFGSATFNATGGVVGQGTGTFDLGALPVTLNAPVYLADTSSDATLKTTGILTLNASTGQPLIIAPVGGAMSLIGGTVNDNGAQIEAPAGNVSLEATSGDLTIAPGSLVSSAGVSKQFFDIAVFAPAGAITLTADTGTVNVEPGSTLDFSGANGGGAAGSLTLSAPNQTVQLAGTIKGNAADGFMGGSFSLNTGGAVDLDSLASGLASGGVNNQIEIETNAGDLVLSAGTTLTAHTVGLLADGGAGGQDTSNGSVQIFGTIDASGQAGGEIDLYGKSGVDIEGSLLATGSSPTQRGGTVNVGATGTFNGTVNATYGYENIDRASAGSIRLGGSSIIDVSSVGSAGGLSGGTVNFRAPLLDDGTVNVTVVPAGQSGGIQVNGAQIKGARSVDLEAYAVWSTDDPLTAGASKHFDGIVDPAGWYGNSVAGAGQPGMVTGTWTDQSGNPLPSPTPDQLVSYLANDFFTPATGAGGVNTDHETFYGFNDGDPANGLGTLMNFVQNGLSGVANPFAAANIANSAVVPGIELDNPDPTINGGNISILTNWNLGAAGLLPGSLAFRFNGQAPVITFRAENNVNVDASLTDGFFQIANPANAGTSIPIPPPSTYTATDMLWSAASGYYASSGYGLNYYGPTGPGFAKNLAFAPQLISGDPQEVAEYYALYTAYAEVLNEALPINSFINPVNIGKTNIYWALRSLNFGFSTVPGEPAPPVAPSAATQQSDPSSYFLYLQQYETYVTAAFAAVKTNTVPDPAIVAATPPAAQPDTVIGGTSITTSPPVDNTPSPVAVAGNPLPLLSASLTSGASSSFRVVAGANLNSANPLALQAAAIFSAAGGGSVTLDGHFGYVDSNNLTLLAPTMIRTGTGSIDIAAGNNVSLSDPLAPGVIYTAGTPAAGAPPVGNSADIVSGAAGTLSPDILVSPSVNPDSGGDISIHAQNNITGIESVTDDGTVTGTAGTEISQFWWQWMEIGANPTVIRNGSTGVTTDTPITQTSIDFGAFDQGVMSVGGNVTVSAGRDIQDLAVSLPTTWYLTNNNTTVNTVGGGNLTVTAGGNILSGDYFVANGTGTITAGGRIGSDGMTYTVPENNINQPVGPVSTLLATQNGILNVSARQGVDIGGVFDPSYVDATIANFDQYRDSQGYSPSSAVNIESTTGDVDFGTLGSPALIGGGGQPSAVNTDLSFALPATISLSAFAGGITVASGGALAPSATGDLSLIADRTINLTSQNGSLTNFGMLDVDPSSMPSPLSPNASVPALTSISNTAHDQSALHGDDTVPARIYSLNGSIVDGILEPAGAGNAGFYDHLTDIVIDKPALIQAGGDIVNLTFQGQNLREADITRIVAGHDIDDTPLVPEAQTEPGLQLGGPGTFDIEAGHNIGPLTNAQEIFNSNQGFGIAMAGITAVGNANNPNLPHESANVQVLFGVGPSIDDADFIASYINPASSVAGVPSSTPALIAFMGQYDAGQGVDTGLAADKNAAQKAVGTLDAGVAWSQFQALPSYVQQLFAEQVFFSVLTDVGQDFQNSASPFAGQYGRGYQAINTLFPALLGYTANDLNGGANGANKLVSTGNLDIRSTTIQTQQGGNISILGPGGEALVGSASAPPELGGSNGVVLAGPGTQGILTLEQGDINIFTDQSLLLAQSRVFTEQGGAMTIWSSNGDINAGKGSKSVADVPPPEYACDVDHYCTVDARGEVTGAGIATLQTIPGAPTGDVNLIAPRGTVDAGDAGIRVSGNLNVAALHVANADNIQVGGKSTGIPVVAAVDTGALTAGSSAASAATQMAQNLVKNNASGVPQHHWIITVQVEGFGDANDDDDKKHKRGASDYHALSPVAVLGFGGVGRTQNAYLTKEERSELGFQAVNSSANAKQDGM